MNVFGPMSLMWWVVSLSSGLEDMVNGCHSRRLIAGTCDDLLVRHHSAGGKRTIPLCEEPDDSYDKILRVEGFV